MWCRSLCCTPRAACPRFIVRVREVRVRRRPSLTVRRGYQPCPHLFPVGRRQRVASREPTVYCACPPHIAPVIVVLECDFRGESPEFPCSPSWLPLQRKRRAWRHFCCFRVRLCLVLGSINVKQPFDWMPPRHLPPREEHKRSADTHVALQCPLGASAALLEKTPFWRCGTLEPDVSP